MYRTPVYCVVAVALTSWYPPAGLMLGEEKGKAGAVVDKDPYSAIDQHALQATEAAEKSLASLTTYLTRPAKNDREKVRAIFRWMTDRIAYNAEDFLAGRPVGDCSAETVLKQRKSVCEGYANLFERLCKQAGVEVVKVHGSAKGFGYVPGEKIASNHAWNAVKLDGQWQLVDVTWAAGSVDKDKGFLKRLQDYYFLTDPECLIFSHFPDESRWQLLKPAVSPETYQKWPKIDPDWFRRGVAAAEIRSVLQQEDFRGFAKTFDYGKARIHLHQVPLQGALRAGVAYPFRIEAPDSLGMAVIHDGKWQYLALHKGCYEGTVTPVKGPLKVSVKWPDKGDSYWTLLQYEVTE